MVPRRWPVCVLLALLPACGGPEPARPPAALGAQSAILLSLDTLRADHLGLYGYGRDTSPQLDALAARGVVFERAAAQSSATTPSHRSLFQSRPASGFREHLPLLAEVLAAHGLRTAAFTDGANVAAELGFARGFERYGEWEGGLERSLPEIERWLRGVGDAPFFLFLHTFDIHAPFDPPAPFATMFDPDYEGPLAGRDTLALLRETVARRSLDGGPVLSEADRRHWVALYDGGIRYVDTYLGRLFARLDALGLWETTVLVVLSDHGEELWERGSVSHGHTLHEELIHVPLIWRLPGDARAGARVAQRVALMDVAPTLLEILSLPRQATFRGDSLVPLMSGSRTPARPVVSEMHLDKAWIEDSWKLILRYPGREARLFDLAADPGERRSLHAEHPDRVAAFAARLERALAAAADVPALDPVPLDRDDRERLRALGYLE